MSQCSINPSDTPIEREYRRIKDASLNKLSRRYSPLEHPPRVTAPASYLALRTAYHSTPLSWLPAGCWLERLGFAVDTVSGQPLELNG
jgi:hypothetical protein